MIEYLKNCKDEIKEQQEECERRMEGCPDGSLWIVRDKNRIKYIYNYNNSHIGIGKNKELIYKLASKKYNAYKLKEFKLKLKAIDSCIDILSKINIEPYSKKYPLYYNELKSGYVKENNAWSDCEFKSTAGYPEQLNVETSKGIFVRSKSESIIVEALFNWNIPFRYECDFEYFSRTLHPDFTIMRPKDGKIVIWEHFGLMDEISYRNNAINKLQLYSNAGYVLGDNLIITTETKFKPFSYNKAVQTIKEYLL